MYIYYLLFFFVTFEDRESGTSDGSNANDGPAAFLSI